MREVPSRSADQDVAACAFRISSLAKTDTREATLLFSKRLQATLVGRRFGGLRSKDLRACAHRHCTSRHGLRFRLRHTPPCRLHRAVLAT